MRTSLKAAILGTAVAAAVGAVSALPAYAPAFPPYSSPYTHGGSNCGNASDPVTTMFKGSKAKVPNALRSIEKHAGWTTETGSTQSLWVNAGTHMTCNAMGGQRASGLTTRFHARVWRVPHSSGSSKKVMVAPHHEDFVVLGGCFPAGHAVDSNGANGSGFDRGRRNLRRKFKNHGHHTSGGNWGNTRNFKQCDGDWAGSNGNSVVIGMWHVH